MAGSVVLGERFLKAISVWVLSYSNLSVGYSLSKGQAVGNEEQAYLLGSGEDILH